MNRTAYLYDGAYIMHDTGDYHPECPARLVAINGKLKDAPFYNELIMIKARPAELNELKMIHSESYIRSVKNRITRGEEYLDSGDTAVSSWSYDAALLAAGGCLETADAIMKRDAENAFCAVRPPGHHAEYDYAAGFCIFNNVAIVARYLQTHHALKRIAIVDWDVHHGNGIQHSFEDDDTVLYISLHQFPHYPGTGSDRETGRGKGEGYTINFPMKAGSGDSDYLALFKNRIVPALQSFRPDFILISAGFDAHKADPLSSIQLSTEAYQYFTEMIMDVAKEYCEKRLMVLLEGGYNLEALSNSVVRVIKTLHSYDPS